MEREHIPDAIADRYATCPACELRVELDEALVEFDERLTNYAGALRKSELSAVRAGNHLDTEFAAVFKEYGALITAHYTFVEVLRVERAVLVSLFLTGDKYGINSPNRMRVGVMAHDTAPDSWWKKSKRCGAVFTECFARLESTHAALKVKAESVLNSMDTTTMDFLRNGLQPLSELLVIAEHRMQNFSAELEPFLKMRCQVTGNILKLDAIKS